MSTTTAPVANDATTQSSAPALLLLVRKSHEICGEMFGPFEANKAKRLAKELQSAQEAIKDRDSNERVSWVTWAIGDESAARACITEDARRANIHNLHASRRDIENELKTLRDVANQNPEAAPGMATAIARKEQELDDIRDRIKATY